MYSFVQKRQRKARAKKPRRSLLAQWGELPRASRFRFILALIFFGLLLWLKIPHVRLVWEALTWGAWLTVLGSVVVTVRKRLAGQGSLSLFLLVAALVLLNIHLYGDGAVRAFFTKPLAFGFLCLELALIALYLMRGAWRNGGTPYQGVSGRQVPLPSAEGDPRSDHDRYVAAVHEAGHALFFAFAPYVSSLIADIERRDEGERVINGMVRYAKRNQQDGAALMVWDMQYTLAGAEAERVLLGDVHGGNRSDLMHYERVARQYLASHADTEDVLIEDPQTELEVRHNTQVLRRLRREQEGIVREALRENSATLSLLADQLMLKERLDAQEIYKLVGSVRPTPGVMLLDDAMAL